MKKCSFVFGKDYKLVLGKSQFFLSGQQFEIILFGEKIGVLGMVNPKVLKNFGWGHPTAMWEMDVEPL